MKYFEYSLPKTGEFTPKLTTYILDNFNYNQTKLRPIVLIIPGGGYDHYGQREQEPVALKMNSLGFHSAVLHYSIAPTKFPEPLFDLANAVAFIRKNAADWNVDSSKIILCGFSAGGHLAASLGAYWNTELFSTCDNLSPAQIKPNYLLLNYPVITAEKNFCHEGSIKNLIENLSPAEKNHLLAITKSSTERELVSIEKHICDDFPPCFIWHTLQDEAVPAENTIFLVNELKKHKIDFEYHLFNRGKHGLSLSSPETSNMDGSHAEAECKIWPELFVNWLNF